MPRRRKVTELPEINETYPVSLTREGQENRLISLAERLVEQRLRDGSASSQETTFYLKLGAERERAALEKLKMQQEIAKLERENEVLVAKKEMLESSKLDSARYEELTNALKRYNGYRDSEEIIEVSEYVI